MSKTIFLQTYGWQMGAVLQTGDRTNGKRYLGGLGGGG